MYKLFFKLIIIFFSIQFLSLFLSDVVYKDMFYFNYLFINLNLQFLFIFLLFSIFSFFLLIFLLKNRFFANLLSFSILSFSSLFFYALLRLFLDPYLSFIFAIFIFLLIYFLIKNNIFLIPLSYAGVSALIAPSFNPKFFIIILVILSIFDFLMVKKKKMQSLAKIIKKKEVPLAVSFKEIIKGKPYEIEMGAGDVILTSVFASSFLFFNPNFIPFLFLSYLISFFALFLLPLDFIPAMPVFTFFSLLAISSCQIFFGMSFF